MRVVGIVAPLCPAGVNIRGKYVLSRNPEYKTRVRAMWLNVVLTPRVAVGIVASFAPRGSVFGKICFIEKPGVPDEGVTICLNVDLTPG